MLSNINVIFYELNIHFKTFWTEILKARKKAYRILYPLPSPFFFLSSPFSFPSLLAPVFSLLFSSSFSFLVSPFPFFLLTLSFSLSTSESWPLALVFFLLFALLRLRGFSFSLSSELSFFLLPLLWRGATSSSSSSSLSAGFAFALRAAGLGLLALFGLLLVSSEEQVIYRIVLVHIQYFIHCTYIHIYNAIQTKMHSFIHIKHLKKKKKTSISKKKTSLNIYLS